MIFACFSEPVELLRNDAYTSLLSKRDGGEFGRWEGEEEGPWQIDREQNKFTSFFWVIDYPKNWQRVELLFCYPNYSLL